MLQINYTLTYFVKNKLGNDTYYNMNGSAEIYAKGKKQDREDYILHDPI